MNPVPNLSDQLIEWNSIRAERLAILCPEGKPTPAQIHIAEAEADEHIRRLNDPEERAGQKILL